MKRNKHGNQLPQALGTLGEALKAAFHTAGKCPPSSPKADDTKDSNTRREAGATKSATYNVTPLRTEAAKVPQRTRPTEPSSITKHHKKKAVLRTPLSGKKVSKPIQPHAKVPYTSVFDVTRPLNGSGAEVQKNTPPVDHALRKRIREKIACLTDLVEAGAREDANACVVTLADRTHLHDRLQAGASTTLPTPRSSVILDVVLGVDFGTSSTKLVARLPYVAGEPCFAVPAPGFAQAEEHPHLWTSRLWLSPDGCFSLCPEPNAAVLCSIKASLMRPDCDRVFALHTASAAATAMEAAAAFLGLQIRQARGWLITAHRQEFQRGPLRWSYNVGFPAASLNDGALVSRYQACVAAAIRLSALSGELTIEVVRKTIAAVRNPRDDLHRLNGELFPEIAAAVAGFARSRRREDGLYGMVDVGAGTLDCCTFSLVAADGQDRCPIYVADVSMLGVQPYTICKDDLALVDEFRRQLDERQRSVIWTTRIHRYSQSPRWKTGFPLFLVGGGKLADAHRLSTHALGPWLKACLGGHGTVHVKDLPAPDGLVHHAKPEHLHRLAVAVGLSIPGFDIPEVELPHSIDDDSRIPQRDYEAAYIDK